MEEKCFVIELELRRVVMKSSFHMENEFNGYGDKIYLKGLQKSAYAPLSQKNVCLTRDFSGLVLNALGGIPVILNTRTATVERLEVAIAGISMLNRVLVIKSKNEKFYSFKIQVASDQEVTDGSYFYTTEKPLEIVSIPGMVHEEWEMQKDKRWKYRDCFGNYVKGDWIDYKETRYYMDEEGYMVTGWQEIGDKWYYFYDKGDMAISKWIDKNGIWYWVGKNGEWDGKTKRGDLDGIF